MPTASEHIPEQVHCSAVLSKFRLFKCHQLIWVLTYRHESKKNSSLGRDIDKSSVKDREAELQIFYVQPFSYYIPPFTSLIPLGWTIKADSHRCYYFCLISFQRHLKEIDRFLLDLEIIQYGCFAFLGQKI